MLKRFIALVRGAQPEPIEPGAVYALRDGSPWPTKATVTVLATAQGWIRYQIGGGWLLGDERMDEPTFRRIFVRVQK
jgi:hypothetical protein